MQNKEIPPDVMELAKDVKNICDEHSIPFEPTMETALKYYMEEKKNVANLTVTNTAYFGEVQCDFYKNENNDMFMTINQLATALEYSNRNGIEQILQRNPYLNTPEYSTADRLSVVEGNRTVRREMRVFTEDGIYEVTMLSGQPKAKEFRAWVRKMLKAVRKGEIKVVGANDVQQKRLEIMERNARQRQANILLKIAYDKDTQPKYKHIMQAKAAEIVTGQLLLPYETVKQAEYSATQVAQMIGIKSAQAVGALANKLGLKAPKGEENQNGRWIHTKSEHSSKEVLSWVYYDEGVEALKMALHSNAAGQ